MSVKRKDEESVVGASLPRLSSTKDHALQWPASATSLLLRSTNSCMFLAQVSGPLMEVESRLRDQNSPTQTNKQRFQHRIVWIGAFDHAV